MRLALLLAILTLAAVASAAYGNPEEGSISLKSSGFERFKQPVGPRHGMSKLARSSSTYARATTDRTGGS
jgi:hypothetical protein